MSTFRPATATGDSLNLVREALQANGSAIRDRYDDAFMASCPLHTDATPSLSVAWKPASRSGRGGVVVMHCFSCNAPAAAITAAVGLRVSDLFDEPLPSSPAHITRPAVRRRPPEDAHTTARKANPADSHQWRKVRVYTYTSADGRPVQQVIRQRCSCAAGTHKRFLQRYRNGRDWVWRKPDRPTPVLYRARALAQAAANQWVWLTEGEKDADTAAGLGLVATTNAQGAQHFPDQLIGDLQGRSVAIVVDRDAAGYQRATRLVEQLRGRVAQTTILLPAPTHHKADLTDHVQGGHWDPAAPFGGFIQIDISQLEQLAAQRTGPTRPAIAS